jgi:hypothetical protein
MKTLASLALYLAAAVLAALTAPDHPAPAHPPAAIAAR